MLMRKETGLTLTELVVGVALAAILLAGVAVLGTPMLAREKMRSALYEIQTLAQVTRVEAINRNREVRLLLHSGSGQLLVSDTLGTVSDADDRVLFRSRLSDSTHFATPDGAAAVTLKDLGSGWFGTSYDSDGTVVEGQGTVVVGDSSGYRRVSVFGAGGSRVEKWTGATWSTHGF